MTDVTKWERQISADPLGVQNLDRRAQVVNSSSRIAESKKMHAFGRCTGVPGAVVVDILPGDYAEIATCITLSNHVLPDSLRRLWRLLLVVIMTTEAERGIVSIACRSSTKKSISSSAHPHSGTPQRSFFIRRPVRIATALMNIRGIQP